MNRGLSKTNVSTRSTLFPKYKSPTLGGSGFPVGDAENDEQVDDAEAAEHDDKVRCGMIDDGVGVGDVLEIIAGWLVVTVVVDCYVVVWCM